MYTKVSLPDQTSRLFFNGLKTFSDGGLISASDVPEHGCHLQRRFYTSSLGHTHVFARQTLNLDKKALNLAMNQDFLVSKFLTSETTHKIFSNKF